MTRKINDTSHNLKIGSKNALIGGIFAGLTAPSIFFTPPVYGSHIHQNGLNTDFRNVGIYMRSALGKYRLGVRNEKVKKT